MHVNPVTSDGSFTIGYDADGLAGQWPGNMTEITKEGDFMTAYEGQIWSDGDGEWDAYLNHDEQIVWRNKDGNWTPIDVILREYGDR